MDHKSIALLYIINMKGDDNMKNSFITWYNEAGIIEHICKHPEDNIDLDKVMILFIAAIISADNNITIKDVKRNLRVTAQLIDLESKYDVLHPFKENIYTAKDILEHDLKEMSK